MREARGVRKWALEERARQKAEAAPEVRIVAEIAGKLHLSTRFSDDRVQEGTVERPLALHEEPTKRVRPRPSDEVEDEVEVSF